MRGAILGTLLACGQVSSAPLPLEPPLQVRTWLDGPIGASGGTMVVQVESPKKGGVEIIAPDVPGLLLVPAGPARVESIGDRLVETQSWTFSATPGAWEIPGFRARWADGIADPGEATSTALFVEIGAETPPSTEFADIGEPPPVRTLPWRGIGLALGVASVAAGALVVALRRRKTPLPKVDSTPPDVRALRAWEATRADPMLDPHTKALALSRIFREYGEAVLHFPATAWSTTETLNHLGALPHLAEGNVPRARRLLRATDRVKYADATPGLDLFDELDVDLRAFVATTRPHVWETQ